MKYLIPALLLLLFITGCKKEEGPKNTTMTVYVSNSTTTTWTTTEVSSFLLGNTLSIAGTDPVTRNKVKLSIYDYREGRRTYAISPNDVGVNTGGNVATYDFETNSYIAQTGNISISNYTTTTIDGTFDFTGPGGHVYGTFKAPLP